ncbi:MAG TPA: hypothetical protein VEG65_07345 [Candidatus Bathyarchaeia archaeon]|nr:hypothetical protein [Candidatus Bathyarchaeia archaeon]
MNKRCLTGLIAVIVLGAVLVAGCTSPTTTSPTPSATTSTSVTRDPFLDRLVISMESELRNNTTVSAWIEKWENGSTVTVQAQYGAVTLNRTVIRFASIDGASAYAKNVTAGYVVTTNVTKVTSLPYRAYQLTKGSAPTVYTAWTRVEIRPVRTDIVQQIDDTVVIDSVSTGAGSTAAGS